MEVLSQPRPPHHQPSPIHQPNPATSTIRRRKPLITYPSPTAFSIIAPSTRPPQVPTPAPKLNPAPSSDKPKAISSEKRVLMRWPALPPIPREPLPLYHPLRPIPPHVTAAATAPPPSAPTAPKPAVMVTRSSSRARRPAAKLRDEVPDETNPATAAAKPSSTKKDDPKTKEKAEKEGAATKRKNVPAPIVTGNASAAANGKRKRAVASADAESDAQPTTPTKRRRKVASPRKKPTSAAPAEAVEASEAKDAPTSGYQTRARKAYARSRSATSDLSSQDKPPSTAADATEQKGDLTSSASR
ncbi:hypothetical protein SISSUDRAFT_1042874 [Sistotremastrum suecicum HHB10207 ss-3]|uniref:Uncharacterized protein n=1 Tax=Sistotremastrum suecicum HHB10207 ss-3 TaxID=1314776 RepID=A0A166GBD6_9AGAM|nr:hypothetical protein SISSUDRAFT_1042874 [Sistotremastrum suecicum HHB10207 ss-3]